MIRQIENVETVVNRKLARAGILMALALSFQIGLMPLAQPAVGPLVNMTLVIAAVVVGPALAVLIGCITPFMAFLLGIMPLPVLVPVVILGNTALILVYTLMCKGLTRSFSFLSLLVAATAKFLVMATMIRFIAHFFMPNIPQRLIHAFSLPQLYTALLGGLMALLILRYLPINKMND
ncbi:ECF transporter S component [Anoxynatronum sibiricum]|uniref:ECF transporter S component n=1 Tax=Anoxynatronum sibiricum TaxID=210623 RepID=A0ABU9VNZ2_9CLOT